MQAIYGARLLMLSVEWLTDNGFSIASFMTGRPIDPPTDRRNCIRIAKICHLNHCYLVLFWAYDFKMRFYLVKCRKKCTHFFAIFGIVGIKTHGRRAEHIVNYMCVWVCVCADFRWKSFPSWECETFIVFSPRDFFSQFVQHLFMRIERMPEQSCSTELIHNLHNVKYQRLHDCLRTKL